MAWTLPQYDKSEVNTAGRCLIADAGSTSVMERDRMLDVINNWRSSHSFPLQCIKMVLTKRSKTVDEKAIVAQRLKRLLSIDAKLRQHSTWMKLTQMQDIGGCRAIVRNVTCVERIVETYRKAVAKNPKRGYRLQKENDYISHPKIDGYRSYHLIFRYRSLKRGYRPYNDLKIEIQIRSRLQHAWATALETVSTFTGQALKSSGGEENWRRFFVLMSAAFAIREKRAPVPGAPHNKAELVDELRALADQLNVEVVLEAWRISLRQLAPKGVGKDTAAYLLHLDPAKETISSVPYTIQELPQASEAYLQLEKKIAAAPTPGAQAVLVSVNSLQALRKAYPNFYLDTTVFVEALNYALLRMVKPPKIDTRQGALFQ